MKAKQRIGAGLLSVVIIVVIAYSVWPEPGPPPSPTPGPTQITTPTQNPNSNVDPTPTQTPGVTVVKGYGGGLKVDFLRDPEVETILRERYGLEVQIDGVGSIQIACNVQFVPDDDFVWLGDSVALAAHQQCGGVVLSTENIYYSPVVLYSWAPIVDALVANGVARLEQDGSYSVDFERLIELVETGQAWASLGLPQLYGPISVKTTDPQRSNSGFLFAGLLANTKNGGNVVNTTTVTPLLPGVQTFILRGGYMPGRSSDLWNQFLVMGMGAYPIVTLYESQIIEHIIANPDQVNAINQQVRILYPQPTVWATHPFVARTDDGRRLMEALLDPDIQRIAAEKHGHRPSDASVTFAPTVTGIRTSIDSVTGMPAPPVMDQILQAIASVPVGAAPTSAASPPAATLASPPPE